MANVWIQSTEYGKRKSKTGDVVCASNTFPHRGKGDCNDKHIYAHDCGGVLSVDMSDPMIKGGTKSEVVVSKNTRAICDPSLLLRRVFRPKNTPRIQKIDMVEPVYIKRKVVTSGETNIEYAPAKLTNKTAADAKLIMSDLRPLFGL